jgi:hypothetical protein
MFNERLIELRHKLAQATDLEATQVLAADIARIERVIKIEEERLASQDLSGRVRVDAQRANETDTEFRARAEKEMAAVAVV